MILLKDYMDKPRVAVCLYGQPRRYQEGYNTIMDIVKANPEYQFDFYYHTWTKPKDISGTILYEASKWRPLSKEELTIDENILEKLNDLYKPFAYCTNNPINFDIDKDSIMYKVSSDKDKENANNITSHLFSRQSVRNILEKVVLTYNLKYEYVLSVRFDCLLPFNLKINTLEKNRLYISDIKLPCKLMGDLFICDINMYFNVNNSFNNLKNIINNTELQEYMKGINEGFYYTAEDIVSSNYVYYYNTLDNIVRTDAIPNFWFDRNNWFVMFNYYKVKLSSADFDSLMAVGTYPSKL